MNQQDQPKIIRLKGVGDDFGIMIILNGESYWLSPNVSFEKIWEELKDLRDFIDKGLYERGM
jgi:hypothetical protein